MYVRLALVYRSSPPRSGRRAPTLTTPEITAAGDRVEATSTRLGRHAGHAVFGCPISQGQGKSKAQGHIDQAENSGANSRQSGQGANERQECAGRELMMRMLREFQTQGAELGQALLRINSSMTEARAQSQILLLELQLLGPQSTTTQGTIYHQAGPGREQETMTDGSWRMLKIGAKTRLTVLLIDPSSSRFLAQGLEAANCDKVGQEYSLPDANEQPQPLQLHEGPIQRVGSYLSQRIPKLVQESRAGQVLRNLNDLDEFMSTLVASKNPWFNEGGFSPAQLVFGQSPMFQTTS